METNMSSTDKLANLFQTIGQTARLQILLAIGEGEPCVCHLEATFGWRQAYLSQHLMALRKAGVLLERREGRYIFYHLSDPRLLDMLRQMSEIWDVSLPETPLASDCSCPHCSSQAVKNGNETHQEASLG
jgi:DNA-binding transcriptional ArsR family regulator